MIFSLLCLLTTASSSDGASASLGRIRSGNSADVVESDFEFGRFFDRDAGRDVIRELYVAGMDFSMQDPDPTPTPTSSPTAPDPTPSPSASPTICQLSRGTSYTFNSYLMEEDLFFDDIYVRHKFGITVKCDCMGKAINGGTVGPTIEESLIDQSAVAGPIVNTVNNKDLQVDWEGSGLEDDAPGWTIVAAGGSLCFTPAAKTGICLIIAGLATEIFDDEIFWAYKRSVTFSCTRDSRGEWEVRKSEAGPPLNQVFKTNDSEYYTKYE